MIFNVENGCFAYSKGDILLRDISFEISSGEILAVLGPNGAGKTTLLRCMTGMLPWRSGRTMLDGEDIRGISPRILWQRMAYVPQNGSGAGSYTVFQTVLLGRSSRAGIFSSPSVEDIRATETTIDRLGLSELSDRPCYTLSGGERKMVLIARALAAEPELLILDEPESNLDFRNQLIVLDTISELAAGGTACIFNTHYPSHALQRADRALLISEGGQSEAGPVLQVVTEQSIRNAFGVNARIEETGEGGNIIRTVIPLGIAEDSQKDWS